MLGVLGVQLVVLGQDITDSLPLPGAFAITRGHSGTGGKGKWVGIGEVGAAGREFSLP